VLLRFSTARPSLGDVAARMQKVRSAAPPTARPRRALVSEDIILKIVIGLRASHSLAMQRHPLEGTPLGWPPLSETRTHPAPCKLLNSWSVQLQSATGPFPEAKAHACPR